MSGYSDGEALVLAALRKHANYDSENTSRADWKILNSGKAPFYVILRPGPFTVEVQSIGGIGANATATEVSHWVTQLMVYQRYIDDGTTATNLQARVAEIIAQIQKWRRLGDANDIVQRARVVSGDELVEVQQDQASPLYLRWILDVNWDEERTITFSE
jgi:hypothetical protein